MYEHLRALREDKDLSQKQLADLLQVHQTTYSDYERGNVGWRQRRLSGSVSGSSVVGASERVMRIDA